MFKQTKALPQDSVDTWKLQKTISPHRMGINYFYCHKPPGLRKWIIGRIIRHYVVKQVHLNFKHNFF